MSHTDHWTAPVSNKIWKGKKKTTKKSREEKENHRLASRGRSDEGLWRVEVALVANKTDGLFLQRPYPTCSGKKNKKKKETVKAKPSSDRPSCFSFCFVLFFSWCSSLCFKSFLRVLFWERQTYWKINSLEKKNTSYSSARSIRCWTEFWYMRIHSIDSLRFYLFTMNSMKSGRIDSNSVRKMKNRSFQWSIDCFNKICKEPKPTRIKEMTQ